MLTVRDRVRPLVVLDTGLVFAGAERWEHVAAPAPIVVPSGGARPALPLRSRTFVDDDGAVCLSAALPPAVRRGHLGVSVSRRVREVRVAGADLLVWSLLRHLDGENDVATVLGRLPDPDAGGRLLAELAGLGAVDVEPRPVGRFLHEITKRGGLPGDGLSPDDTARLVTDGEYRHYPGNERTKLEATVSEELAAFHALTRRRRSADAFAPGPIGLPTLGTLLHTACGVTGSVDIAGRELRLRAYPSAGALYAVEVYPVVLDVAGLDPGVYHYLAFEESLEHLRPGSCRGALLDSALPAQRSDIDGASVAFCLTGVFSRFERKYGEGGYRILAAEAGHLAQNLILTATALGLGARPVGGFFDDLLNRMLGLDTGKEQFLLCVLLGQRGPAPGDGA